jgi:hypothetical protein
MLAGFSYAETMRSTHPNIAKCLFWDKTGKRWEAVTVEVLKATAGGNNMCLLGFADSDDNYVDRLTLSVKEGLRTWGAGAPPHVRDMYTAAVEGSTMLFVNIPYTDAEYSLRAEELKPAMLIAIAQVLLGVSRATRARAVEVIQLFTIYDFTGLVVEPTLGEPEFKALIQYVIGKGPAVFNGHKAIINKIKKQVQKEGTKLRGSVYNPVVTCLDALSFTMGGVSPAKGGLRLERVRTLLQNFDPSKVLILQYDNRGAKVPFPELRARLQAYALMWGFTYRLDTDDPILPPWWMKPYVIHRAMNEMLANGQYRWECVWFFDCDATIHDMTVRPHELFQPGMSMVASPDPESWHSPINADVVLFLNDDLGRGLAECWAEQLWAWSEDQWRLQDQVWERLPGNHFTGEFSDQGSMRYHIFYEDGYFHDVYAPGIQRVGAAVLQGMNHTMFDENNVEQVVAHLAGDRKNLLRHYLADLAGNA